MIDRRNTKKHVAAALDRGRVVALLGPRQVGKTTLARMFVGVDSPNYFDLENRRDVARLSEPLTGLEPISGLVVIDEVQHVPELFKTLRVLADRQPAPAKFLVLGSASFALLRQAGESLTGRLEVIEVGGLTLGETGVSALEQLWLRGGLPRSWLASSDEESFGWRDQYLRLTVERDLPMLGITVASQALHRFWAMTAHYHGQIWSNADPARSLGVSEPTVRRYLDLLSGALLVRQLQPWHENLGKRQVKSPKVYVRDSGLLHALLGIITMTDLLRHPKLGASWEGFLIDQILAAAKPQQAYFWATHQGAELDLLMFKHGRRVGVEFKRSDAPTLTASMRIAMHDLKLDALYVVYPGQIRYALAERIEAIPATSVAGMVD